MTRSRKNHCAAPVPSTKQRIAAAKRRMSRCQRQMLTGEGIIDRAILGDVAGALRTLIRLRATVLAGADLV